MMIGMLSACDKKVLTRLQGTSKLLEQIFLTQYIMSGWSLPFRGTTALHGTYNNEFVVLEVDPPPQWAAQQAIPSTQSSVFSRVTIFPDTRYGLTYWYTNTSAGGKLRDMQYAWAFFNTSCAMCGVWVYLLWNETVVDVPRSRRIFGQKVLRSGEQISIITHHHRRRGCSSRPSMPQLDRRSDNVERRRGECTKCAPIWVRLAGTHSCTSNVPPDAHSSWGSRRSTVKRIIVGQTCSITRKCLHPGSLNTIIVIDLHFLYRRRSGGSMMGLTPEHSQVLASFVRHTSVIRTWQGGRDLSAPQRAEVASS